MSVKTVAVTSEAESLTLGSMLLSEEAAKIGLHELEIADFFYECNQKIFQAMQAVISRGEIIDGLSVRTELDKLNQLADVGGDIYLINLQEVHSAANIAHYCETVRKYSKVRQICSQAHTAYKALRRDPDAGLEMLAAGNGQFNFSELALSAKGNRNKSRWQKPVAFGEYVLPPFPTKALPRWAGDYVEALSNSTQTPTDMAGTFGLAVCSACIAKMAEISCGPAWIEPLNLFTFVSMEPASRKTTVVKEMAAPIEEYEAETAQEDRKSIVEAQTQRDILAARLQQAKSEAARLKADKRQESRDEAHHLAAELDSTTIPMPSRLVADDCTPERLQSLMAEQHGRIAVLSAEGGIIISHMMGRYSDGKPNLGVYLAGHGGDTIRVDRKADRQAEFIRRPALTIGITAQPDVLRSLTSKPELRGRGLLGRFLYSLPVSNIGYRSTEQIDLPSEIQRAYRASLWNILDARRSMEQEKPVPAPAMLHLSPQANELFTEFRREVEGWLQPGADLGEMLDWGGKLCGAVARIMGVLHIAEHGAYGLMDRVIACSTAANAISLGRYFKEHAQAAYGEMGADKEIDNARHLLSWIVRNRKSPFTRREAHNSLQKRFKRADDLDKPLSILEERAYIRERNPEAIRSGRGRKPSAQFDVNPHALDG